jgi:hypothetical protein
MTGLALQVPVQGVPSEPDPDAVAASFAVLGAGGKSKIAGHAICVKRRSESTTLIPRPDGFEVSAGGMRYVHVEDTIPNGTIQSLQAECSEGREVLGGAAGALVDAGHLNASYPIDAGDSNPTPDDGWHGFLFNSGGGAPPAFAQAFCQRREAPMVKHLRYEAGDAVTIPAPGSESAVVRCPRHRSVAGGGVFVTGSSEQAAVVASTPVDLGDPDHAPDDGWLGKVVNEAGASKTLTVHVTCGEG